MTLLRGSLVWVDLGHGEGSEQAKRRPAVIVSNNGVNRSAEAHGRGVLTVIPLRSASRPPFAFQVAIPREGSHLPSDSIAQVEQIRAVDVRRLRPTGHHLPDGLIDDINQALQLHLYLW